MTAKTIHIEAESQEEAREQAKAQMPVGYRIYYESVHSRLCYSSERIANPAVGGTIQPDAYYP